MFTRSEGIQYYGDYSTARASATGTGQYARWDEVEMTYLHTSMDTGEY
jgi:hypothetical protein